MNSNQVLERYFGYESFRNGQEQLVDSIISGRDTLGVMPTGAGKSICYQVPALMHSGITIVISPLISLMQDQVRSLVEAGIRAAYINSSLTMNQLYAVINNARNGVYKLIYIAPERLDSDVFMDFAVNADISMITVDEAHCISQWGQDFRPSYLNIPRFASALPRRPVISAFTATATEQVRNDIINLLGLNDPFTLVTGFDRKNLYFEVRKPSEKYMDVKRLVSSYLKENRSGIIYCSTRKNVENVCQKLCDDGFKATRYHAGLDENERRINQEDFIYDRKKIMVATNAFGMGIDKSNVTFVIHYNMPMDVESYYQEAGRAGRDGSESDCILLYSGQDVVTAKYLIDKSFEDSQLEPAMAHEMKEKDLNRLRDMTFYCTTTSCLRTYILRYFGEKAYGKCGNCSGCCADTEVTDITVEAQKIMSCIFRSGQSQTADTISSILRGTENTQEFRELSTFGIMSDTGHERIKNITGRLEDMGFISSYGKGQLRLNASAADVLKGNVKVETRLAAETIVTRKNTANNALFEKLVELRAKIASIQSVPAYVIFTDTTLREMSEKMPCTNKKLLAVEGVSSAKLSRYGDRFLAVIKDYSKQNSPAPKDKTASGTRPLSENRPRRKGGMEELKKNYTIIIKNRDRISEPGGNSFISAISEKIKTETGTGMTASALRKDIVAWLENEGMLIKCTDKDNKMYMAATEKAGALGIYNEDRVSETTGKEYIRVVYTPEAQRYVTNNIENVLNYILSQMS